MRIVRFAGLVAAGLFSIAAAANDPAERLADPAKEARARGLFRVVRCLVCQNESIDDSDADLAEDLRRVVRAEVAAGRSDADVKRYLVDRYGEFVLLQPSFSPGNALLWLTPVVLILGGGGLLILRARKTPAPTPPLSGEEEAALAALDVSPVHLHEHASAAEAPNEKLTAVAKT